MSTTDTTCTCPSGDGSLRWPCPTHPRTQPAPAGVIDREAIARSLHAVDAEHEFLGDDSQAWDDSNQGYYLRRADAVLAVLPGRTVAQVKAEALREAAAEVDWEWETFRAGDGMPSIRMHGKTPSELLKARADELEREDKR